LVVTYRKRDHCLSPVLFYALQVTKHGDQHPTSWRSPAPYIYKLSVTPLKLGRAKVGNKRWTPMW